MERINYKIFNIITANTNSTLTINSIENIKNALLELEKTVFLHIPQGITVEYNTSKENLINWLDEMEFTVLNYKDCDC